jgi:dihydropteroate synthase
MRKVNPSLRHHCAGWPDRSNREGGTVLRLGEQAFEDEPLVMAIVNRTPDSFYDKGATFAFEEALRRVDAVVAEGADIVDVGGVKAAPGTEVGVAEEIDRVVPFIAEIRSRYPQLIISVDTWRSEVGREACRAGADLLNDAWGGVDPALAEVAAEYRAALVCTHAGGLPPRTRPHRPEYDDVVADVIARTTALAERAVAVGVERDRVMIDPGHDFGKNTWHSLEVTRRLGELVATGWPVLVSLSNKDFVGESLGGLPVTERMYGTLAASAICAWQGARVFRAHNVGPTRQTIDMVAVTRGQRPPALTVRGLA